MLSTTFAGMSSRSYSARYLSHRSSRGSSQPALANSRTFEPEQAMRSISSDCADSPIRTFSWNCGKFESWGFTVTPGTAPTMAFSM